MLELNFKNEEELKYYFENTLNADEIYPKIYESIKNGFNKKVDTILFAKIKLEDEGREINMDINRVDWIHNLNQCISYYLKIENYEMCSNIQKYISLLNEN